MSSIFQQGSVSSPIFGAKCMPSASESQRHKIIGLVCPQNGATDKWRAALS